MDLSTCFIVREECFWRDMRLNHALLASMRLKAFVNVDRNIGRRLLVLLALASNDR